ncbi:hypothetical protein AAF712_004469 [Marasmius tenuissimus]|uniref:Uncharacterized protein n=1 Tax=Marasmius tenuissimus TaxID=585030 RepID=A0ABR3A324_9AGAR
MSRHLPGPSAHSVDCEHVGYLLTLFSLLLRTLNGFKEAKATLRLVFRLITVTSIITDSQIIKNCIWSGRAPALMQSTTNMRFATPKGRRLHLIQAHGYPKEYYFHVTVLGVGGLLKRWGEGASMIQEWKPRGSVVKDTTDAKDQDDGKGEENNVSDHLVDDTSDDGNESDATERQSANGYATKIKDNGTHSDADDGHISNRDGDADKLAESMSSLSLVPGSIRFGRGSVKVGFSPAHNGGHMIRGRGRGGRGRARGFIPNADHSVPKGANSEGPGMEIDSSATGYNNHRGRGAYRGRVGPGPMSVPASVTFGRGGIAARRGLRPRGRGA